MTSGYRIDSAAKKSGEDIIKKGGKDIVKVNEGLNCRGWVSTD